MAQVPGCVATVVGFVDLAGEEAHAGIELYCCVVVVVAGCGEGCLFVAEEW